MPLLATRNFANLCHASLIGRHGGGCHEHVPGQGPFLLQQPPWTLIQLWLSRLLHHPHITCWTVVPFWASSAWFPLLKKMLVPGAPVWVVPPFMGLFRNCMGELMPAPRWPLFSVYCQDIASEGTNFVGSPKHLCGTIGKPSEV